MNSLEIKDLCKSYKGFSLDHISLTLPSGCIMGLIGENGAGKSTTIRLILNMINKNSGTITVLGKDNCELTKEDIGIVLDEVGFPDCVTAEQVNKIMRLIFKQWNEDEYFKYIKKLDLPVHKEFKDFSKGMKMKLGIACALSHSPKLLILDEATSGLDPIARDELIDTLNDFTRDDSHSVLISSHIVSDLEKLCDYIAFLHKGKLLLCEEKDRLLEDYCIVHGSGKDLNFPGVLPHRASSYGIDAVAKRRLVPHGMKTNPVSIEELFVCMVKEAE